MIAGIVAVENSQGIGFENQMPWPHLKGDMKSFVRLTTDTVVIMGSNTFKSLKSPLPNRINAVISSTLRLGAHFTYTDPVEAINDLKERFSKKDIFIIGGQAVYDSVKDLIDVYYVTKINADYTCDKFFNLSYVEENYPIVTELETFESTETTPSYTIYEYKK